MKISPTEYVWGLLYTFFKTSCNFQLMSVKYLKLLLSHWMECSAKGLLYKHSIMSNFLNFPEDSPFKKEKSVNTLFSSKLIQSSPLQPSLFTAFKFEDYVWWMFAYTEWSQVNYGPLCQSNWLIHLLMILFKSIRCSVNCCLFLISCLDLLSGLFAFLRT